VGRVSETNVDVVRRLFRRFGEGGIEAALDGLHEDLVIEIPPDLSAEPDTYHGHDGARRYFSGFAGTVEDLRYEALEVVPAGEHVLAAVRLSGRGVSSGIDTELRVVVLHALRDGKVVYIRPYPDMESAREAAGQAG
jgi:ketosteroid isomerase-like protein